MYTPIAGIKPASYYRRRIVTIYVLLALVFVVGGIIAFVFDSVTLSGRTGAPAHRRTGAATFDGRAPQGVGVFCFFLSAYWLAKSARHYTASRQLGLAPYIAATVASLAPFFYQVPLAIPVVATPVCAPR